MMAGVVQSVLTIILSVGCIIGNLGNGFIAVVNFMDWTKRRKMSSAHQILTALAISRIVFLSFLFLYWWVSVLCPVLLKNTKMLQIIYFTWAVTTHFIMWLATCLSILYFLKIANFSNSTFLYLKWRVKKVVSVTLLGSLLLLFLNILLLEVQDNGWIEFKGNVFYSSSSRNSTQSTKILLFTETVFIVIPFTVSLTTFLLLIINLWKHMKRAQHNVRGSRDASTMAHIKALQTMIASLLLYITFYMTLIVHFSNHEFVEENPIVSFFLDSILIASLLGHALILILKNNNLRQVSSLVLMWLRCWCKDVESLDS